MKQYTDDQLAEHDGRQGKPAFIAHRGMIYDVTQSKLWPQGQHMKRHHAGKDLSTDIQAAPHGVEVLERVAQVGRLVAPAKSIRPMPAWLSWVMTTNPFLRRHPHPMTVHFPIAFMLANPVFISLFLISGNRSFEITSHHCLGCGILGIIAAMVTGFFTWWYNYQARAMTSVILKISLSLVTLAVALILFFWRLNAPGVVRATDDPNFIYLALSFSFIPLISIIGWLGATLTFPIERD